MVFLLLAIIAGVALAFGLALLAMVVIAFLIAVVAGRIKASPPGRGT